MNSDEIVQVQRRLRAALLDTKPASSIPGASDLTAHLLLYLDDTARCWQLTLEWLRCALDADRVDGGFANPARNIDQPLAESVRRDLDIPSSVGTVIDAREASVRSVWASSEAVVFENVAGDARFTPLLRAQLLSLNTQAKLAVSLRDGSTPIGLICCDWTRTRHCWTADQCEQISTFASRVLSPIFSMAYRSFSAADEPSDLATSRLVRLTPSELKVARLVVTGMSYKEIARQLNRSFSTVDHCLRNIRDKLGVRSTARMMCILPELLSKQYSQ